MEDARRPTRKPELRRFTCRCGRRVVTEEGTDADAQRCCSRCRRTRTSLVASSQP